MRSTAAGVPLAAGSRTEELPKIFVYELPETTTYKGAKVNIKSQGLCEGLTPDSKEELHCLFGEPLVFGLQPDDTYEEAALKAHDVGQFSLFNIFLASLSRHPQRTLDPNEADLFFITANANSSEDWSQEICPHADTLVQLLPYLNASSARRHFWLDPTVGWKPHTCLSFNAGPDSDSQGEKLLAATTKMALEDRACAPANDPEIAGEWKVKMGFRGPPSAYNLHSIPYPSILSGLGADDLRTWNDLLSAPRQRRHLVSASWGPHGTGWTMDMREKLRKQCEASEVCSFSDLDGLREITNTELVLDEKLHSTFCLEPTGDTISRKGIVDDIIAGCIPVLLSGLQARLWPWHVGHWETVAVTLEWPHENVIGYLANMPAREIERLQDNMESLIPRLTYSAPGSSRPNDALETALQAIWMEAM